MSERFPALTVCVAATAGLLLSAAPGRAMSKCLERDGRCMTVTVNGQAVVKLSKRTKAMLKDLQAAVSYVDGDDMRQTRYEVPLPIRGPLQVSAERSPDSGDWFGEGRTVRTLVRPLDQVDLKSRQQIAAAEGVSVAGAAPLFVQDVLTDNQLPPGRYVLIIDLNGRGNWDRMTLYVQVEE
ncbi:MAG: hypothetical protein ABW221_10045 [Vicinamibacteria bacterium]